MKKKKLAVAIGLILSSLILILYFIFGGETLLLIILQWLPLILLGLTISAVVIIFRKIQKNKEKE